MTVFLTVALVVMGGSPLSSVLRKLYGLDGFEIPPALAGQITEESTEYCLGKIFDYGYRPIEVLEAESDGNARYIGLRLSWGECSIPLREKANESGTGCNR